MTQADKTAKELVYWFYDNIQGLELEQAKVCALKCVEEILKYHSDYDEYLFEVKQAINKL